MLGCSECYSPEAYMFQSFAKGSILILLYAHIGIAAADKDGLVITEQPSRVIELVPAA